MQNENRIRLNKESNVFECEYKGEFNGLGFTLVHKKYTGHDDLPMELLEIVWDNILPSRDDLPTIEEAIKTIHKNKQK